MANNFTIESIDIDRIRRGDANATADAITLLYSVANDEAKRRRTGLREAIDKIEGSTQFSAPTASQDNFAIENATLLVFNGSSSINLTGIRAGVVGRMIFIIVLGTGTITVVHDSANSDTLNRIKTSSSANVAVTTGRVMPLAYIDDAWREMDWI